MSTIATGLLSAILTLSSVRDNYDSKKEEHEAQISELLGTKFTVNINPQELWAYATDNNSTASYVLNGYFPISRLAILRSDTSVKSQLR